MQVPPLTTLAREAVEDLARTDPLSPAFPDALATALELTARADDARAVAMAWLKGGATERATELARDYDRVHRVTVVPPRRRAVVAMPPRVVAIGTRQRPDRSTDPSAA